MSVVLIDLEYFYNWLHTDDRINIILELNDYDKIQISVIMHETSFSVWSLFSVFSSSHKKIKSVRNNKWLLHANECFTEIDHFEAYQFKT